MTIRLPIMRQAVRQGSTLLCSGHYAVDAPGRQVAEQTASTLRFLDRSLAEAGTDKLFLLQATAYLADIETDLEDFFRVWNDWVPRGHAPALTCVQAGLVTPHYRVVIMAQAALP